MELNKWRLTREEQERYIGKLEEQLVFLRAQAGLSQAELAEMIGISRQTISAIERRRKEMSWSVYLSLILFFDCHAATHELLRSLPAFPSEFIQRINEGIVLDGTSSGQSADTLHEILGELDERALMAFRTMLQIEYARCRQKAADQSADIPLTDVLV